MELRIVADLIARTWFKYKVASVFQLGMKLAVETEQYMPLRAPMIGQISRTVLDHPYPDIAELAGFPVSNALCADVLSPFNRRPVRNPKV